LATFDTFVRQ